MNGTPDHNNDFCRAVLLAYDQSTTNSSNKQYAIQYCNDIKQSANGYVICLEQLHYACVHHLRDEIKFYCLSTLLYHIQTYYNTQYNEQQKITIRSSIMILIRDVINIHVQPNYIKNKMCTVLVELIKYDYTTQWNTFFTDFISLLNPNTIEIVDLFIRMLNVLDDEVVVVDDRRNDAEVLHNTAIKDSMRIHDINSIINCIIWIVSTFNNNKPSLVISCLDCLANYIEWIDIQLSVHQTMLSMLYTCLMQQSTQLHAAQCLCEIVVKRMDSAKKIILVRDIQLIEVVNKIDMQAANQKYSRRIAQLITSIGEQLCIAIKDITKSNESMQLVDEAYELLERVMSMAYNLLQYNRWKSTRTLIDLLTVYLQLHKSKPMTPTLTSHYQRIFLLILHTIQYPDWFDHEQPDDKEDAYNEYRASLTKLFINLVRYTIQHNDMICQQLSVELNKLFQSTNDIQTIPFAPLEAILKLHYTLGEAIQKSTTTRICDANDILTQMTYTILSSDISYYKHSVIQIRWHEIVHRYNKIMEHKSNIIIPLMTSFVDQRGIRNLHPSVAARSSYLLLRTIISMNDTIKQQLVPIISDILTSIQSTIQPILTVTQHTTQYTIAGDECNFLCEAMGALTTTQIVGSQQCIAYAHNISQYFNTQLHTAIQLSSTIDHNTIQYEQLQQCVCCIIESYASYTKPLTKEGNQLSAQWIHSVTVILVVLQSFTDSESIHCKVVTYLHRMVDCMQSELLPALPALLDVLLQYTTANSIVVYIQLLGQLVSSYKQQFESMLDELLTPLFQHYFQLIQQYNSIDTSNTPVATHTIKMNERLTLIRTMITLLKQILSAELSNVLTTSSTNQQLVPSIIQWLLQCCQQTDPVLLKSVYAVFRQLVTIWHKLLTAQQIDTTYYKKLIYHDIVVQQLSLYISSRIDVTFASYDGLIREICELQINSAQLFGNEYIEYMKQLLVSQIGVSNDICNEYIRLLSLNDNAAQLRKFVKQLIVSRNNV